MSASAGRWASLTARCSVISGTRSRTTTGTSWSRIRRVSRSSADLFGDERQDYAAALQKHYAEGPPANWSEQFVTAYASVHPWEDFAETWAHYFHMVDTLETANAFGLRVRPKVAKGADLATTVDFDPHTATMDRIIDSWLPLTFAVNSINRSMGIADLYPFVLAPAVIVKLSFIHDRIHAGGGRPERRSGAGGAARRDRRPQTGGRRPGADLTD